MSTKLAPLRISAYRKLLSSNIVTTFGFWFTYVAAFDLYVFDAGIGPLAVSILGVSSVLPQVIGGPISGVLTDRYDRRNIITISYLLCAPLVGLLVFYQSIWLAYGVFLGTGTLYAVSRPSYRSLIPQIVPDEQLEAANGLLSSSDSTAQIVGPGIAGVFLSFFEPTLLFILDAISYCFAALIVYTLSVTAVDKENDGGFVTEFRDGLSYLKRAPFVLSVVVLGGLMFAAIGVFEAIIPYFLRETLGQNSSMYSLVLLMIGVGSFFGGLTISSIKNRIGYQLVPALAVVILGTSVGAFTIVQGTPAIAIASGAVGVAAVWFTSSAYTTLHRDLDESYHGRIIGVFKSTTRGSQIIAMALAGIMVSVAGTVVLFRTTMVVLVVGGVGWALFVTQKSETRATSPSHDD
ncbi:MFS transporter [Haladaptatus cibarius]|uniref:MFS transporter n=1 Tax=Haladaptatus cibarius TaxID=453847 RepID=UPI000B0414F3|nr:MFS transporter [Haladaptatus cibarius]